MLENNDDFDELDDLDDVDEEDTSLESAEETERDFSKRKLLVIEPDEEKVSKLETVLGEILPGASVTMVDDCDEAMEISDDNEFDTIVVDLQYEEFSSHEFVKMINNDIDILLVSFKVDNVDIVDFQNRFKLEPLRKIFDNTKNAKIKI